MRELFEKFLPKLPANNIKENTFEVDLEVTGLKLGEELHVINAMIDRQTDTVYVEYELLGRPHTSTLGRRDKHRV